MGENNEDKRAMIMHKPRRMRVRKRKEERKQQKTEQHERRSRGI